MCTPRALFSRLFLNPLLPNGGLQEHPLCFSQISFFCFRNFAPCFYVFLNRWKTHIWWKLRYRDPLGLSLVGLGTYHKILINWPNLCGTVATRFSVCKPIIWSTYIMLWHETTLICICSWHCFELIIVFGATVGQFRQLNGVHRLAYILRGVRRFFV